MTSEYTYNQIRYLISLRTDTDNKSKHMSQWT